MPKLAETASSRSPAKRGRGPGAARAPKTARTMSGLKKDIASTSALLVKLQNSITAVQEQFEKVEQHELT